MTERISSLSDQGLEKCAANYQPLSPLSFLKRSVRAFPDRIAVRHGKQTWTYQAFATRCSQLGSALQQTGVGLADRVSLMLANTPPMIEAHYGVPFCGAIMHPINTRLEPRTLAFQIEHAESRILIFDLEFWPAIEKAMALITPPKQPRLIAYKDQEFADFIAPCSLPACVEDYEAFLATGNPSFALQAPDDEWQGISLNYTSGTTGNPKGVVYHHRGAYLLAMSNAFDTGMPKGAVYLWTLPMFHCNGWCFPWTVVALGGTQVCLRWVRAQAMWQAIEDFGVTHMCGAPIVMATLLQEQPTRRLAIEKPISFLTAAAPPPEQTLVDMKEAGFEVTHLYGLTEVYGPAVINDWKPEWNELSSSDQAKLKARQGLAYTALDDLSVRDPETLEATPWDGKTLGEIMFRGNVVMRGYLKNPDATTKAFAGGWFHSGDLAVTHPDGYVEIRDRAKDIIISGGENISSIEVENVLFKHPGVALVSVVAKPDKKWGEVPCAFIETSNRSELAGLDDSDKTRILTDWCRQHLAGFMIPKDFRFQDLPKTSTGKIQKFQLRDQFKSPASIQK